MIKEEYRNLPDTEFIPLKEGVDPVFWDKYEINKLGQFRIKNTKRLLTSVNNKTLVDYPKIILRASTVREKRFAIHRLLAITFIINDNPSEKTVVDHINRDKFDYSLNNLRWVSLSENNKNRIFTSKSNNNFYLEISDENKIIGVHTTYKKDLIKVSKDTYNFYKENLYKEEIWQKHPIYDLYVSSLGGIKFKSGRVTIGYTNNAGYRIVNVDKKLRRVHTLVAETFITKRLLVSGEIVDHISTERYDNSIKNIKVCTQKENMNNPISKEKFSKKVIQLDKLGNVLREFPSITEAYMYLGVNSRTSHISSCCRGIMKTYKGYIWKYK